MLFQSSHGIKISSKYYFNTHSSCGYQRNHVKRHMWYPLLGSAYSRYAYLHIHPLRAFLGLACKIYPTHFSVTFSSQVLSFEIRIPFFFSKQRSIWGHSPGPSIIRTSRPEDQVENVMYNKSLMKSHIAEVQINPEYLSFNLNPNRILFAQ